MDDVKKNEKCDIGSQIALAKNILRQCKINVNVLLNKPDKRELLIKRLVDIFQMQAQTIKTILNDAKPKRKFQTYVQAEKIEESPVPYQNLRDALLKLYFGGEKIVPNKVRTIRALIDKPEYYNEKDLMQDLKINGFIYKKIPNTLRCLIVEDPQHVYERMKYFNKMRSYRAQDKNFVYILIREKTLCLVACPKSGTQDFLNKTQMCKNPCKSIEGIIDPLIPELPESTVLVLDSKSEIKKGVPTQYSSKKTMREWLNNHSIPYDDEMLTAELYSLIRKFRHHYSDTTKIGDFLKGYGCEIVRVPEKLPSLSYFYPISRETITLPYKSESDCVDVFSKYALDTLEESLIKEESKIYDEDLKLENIIDKVIMYARDKKEFQGMEMTACDLYFSNTHPKYIVGEDDDD